MVDPKQLSDAQGLESLSRRGQALEASAFESMPSPRWYVLILRPGFDNAVDNALQEMRLEHWMASLTRQAKRRGGRRFQSFEPCVRPALPGYLFVRTVFTARLWAVLREVQGVADVLGGAMAPSPVKDKEFKSLQRFVDTDPEAAALLTNAIRTGDKVVLDEGPFATFEGIVRLLGKARRATIDVDIFGRSVPMELDLAQVTKID